MLALFAMIIKHYPNLWAAMGLAFILGITLGPVFIATNTMAQVVSDPSMRGKVFSALEIVIHFAFLIAMLLSSWISRFVPEAVILISVGCITSAVGIVGFFKKHNDLRV